jgi:hypothetical protein
LPCWAAPAVLLLLLLLLLLLRGGWLAEIEALVAL